MECSETGIVKTVPRGFGVTHASVRMQDNNGFQLAYNGRGTLTHVGSTMHLRFDGMNDAQVTAELRRVFMEPFENVEPIEHEEEVTVEVSRKEDFVYPVSLYGRNVRDVHSSDRKVYAATESGLYTMSFLNAEGLWSPLCEHIRDARLVSGHDQRTRGHVVYVFGSGRLERITDDSVTNLYDDAHPIIHGSEWHTMVATDRGFWVASPKMVARYHEDSESWEALARPDDDLLIHDLSVISHGYAYACGSAGAVWYYDNRMWRRTEGSIGTASVVQISATNRFNAVAIQHPNVVWFTQNGGHTWNKRNLPGDTSSIVLTTASMSKDDASVTVAGYEEQESRTHRPVTYTMPSDEKSWQVQTVPDAQGPLAQKDQMVQSMHLFDTELCWMACTHGLFVTNRTADHVASYKRTLRYQPTPQPAVESQTEARQQQQEASQDVPPTVLEEKLDSGGLTSGAWAGIGVAIALIVFVVVYAIYIMKVRQDK